MNIQENISLKPYNTFGLEASADFFIEVRSVEELQELVQSQLYKDQKRVLVLGGGSNILLTGDFHGLVIKVSILGKVIVKEDEDHVWLRSGAGEVWHDLVKYALEKGLGGIENLSLIPGTVGAAPMQNIGAYGIEIKEVFDHLEAVNIATGKIELFDSKACDFGYRDSIFKQWAKDKYIIAHVVLKFTKRNHQINTEYGAIKQMLEEQKITTPSVRDISDAVIKIRQSKLPDPSKIGNAGSFFKNPVISAEAFEELRKKFPDMPHYHQHDGVKVPAGWLIEQCGWKGQQRNNIGVHKLQALVLVNLGGGKGEDLKNLALDIQQSVKDKFGIELQPEVNFI
jgi:UDP-N-acetylmuramate dehydrogenase